MTIKKGDTIMKKRLLISVLLVLALTLCCATAFADDSVPPPDQISENPFYAETVWHYLLRTDEFHLTSTRVTITAGSSAVSGYAYSEANEQGYMVGGTMILQQWKDNQWNDYYSVDFLGYNEKAYSISRLMSVTPGYYYRLCVIHRAIAYDRTTSYQVNVTKSVYIN